MGLIVPNSTANYTQIESDGTVRFVGDATVWDDIRVPVTAVKVSTDKPPTWTAFQGGELLAFSYQAVTANEESITFIAQVPHDYKVGTPMECHIHWLPSNTTAGNVRWVLTHSWASMGATFPAASSIGITAACDTAQKHTLSSFGTFSGSGQGISSCIICSLKRNSSTTLDTYSGGSAYLIEVDFHYEKDTVGSRQITSK